MNQPDKDKSIVIQVAAKIAAELTPKDTTNMDTMLGNYAVLFDGIKGILIDEIFGDQPTTAPATQQTDAVQQIMQAFPNTTVVQDAGFSIRVKGTQHGPLPEWLAAACRAKGVTEVWDNRDKLSQNPKRPWFKSTTSDDAFWAPRGK